MRLGEIARVAQGDAWITPRYLEFVQHQRDLAAERDALVQIMTRPPRVRTDTFSASGAGRCLRERQLAYLGYRQAKRDERSMNIFANGDYVHLRYQVAGLVGGWLEEAEVAVSVPGKRLTGTMDGKLVINAGMEIKSINSRGFSVVNSYGVKDDHKEQVHSYMYASGLDTFYVLYENKDTNTIREFRVDRDERIIAKVEQDLIVLNEATDAQELVPMLPECTREEGRFGSCPYRKVCPLATFARSGSRKLSIPRR